MSSVQKAKEQIDFENCYQEFAPRLFAVAYRLLRNQTDALDVVQESFLRAFRKRNNFRGRAKVSTWLYRIVTNRCYDVLRKRSREKKIEYGENYHAKSAGFNGEHWLQQEKMIAMVRQEMEKLTEKQKTVFILRVYEELPYDEIARITHSRVGTVKATFFQSVMKIRKGLKERGVFANELRKDEKAVN
ncbi:MAG: RNA polymerase sigma factor [Candidatus Omnitrophica bacterium]|nr:RNA polymerase sigma factor [Candidatus Omnitrophota bacterium]